MVKLVFGMNHFQAAMCQAHLPKTSNDFACFKILLLAGVKMKKPQRQLTGAIANFRDQHSAAFKRHIGEQYFCFNRDFIAWLQTTDGRYSRAILITKRQVEQQVL